MNNKKLEAFEDDQPEKKEDKKEEETQNNGESIIGRFNNPEMIDDLDMNAGYGSENDYGDEYIDIDLMSDGLKLNDGLFIKQQDNNIPDKYSKYQNISDDDF